MPLSFSNIAGETARVYRVATKGQEKGGDFWVTSYYVSLSSDGNSFFNYSRGETEVTCVFHCHNVKIFHHTFPLCFLFVCLFVCLFFLEEKPRVAGQEAFVQEIYCGSCTIINSVPFVEGLSYEREQFQGFPEL